MKLSSELKTLQFQVWNWTPAQWSPKFSLIDFKSSNV